MIRMAKMSSVHFENQRGEVQRIEMGLAESREEKAAGPSAVKTSWERFERKSKKGPFTSRDHV
jgi:hypothetical protein